MYKFGLSLQEKDANSGIKVLSLDVYFKRCYFILSVIKVDSQVHKEFKDHSHDSIANKYPSEYFAIDRVALKTTGTVFFVAMSHEALGWLHIISSTWCGLDADGH